MRNNTLLSLITLVVTVAVAEVALRVSGIYLTHSEKNTEDGKYFSIRQNEQLDSWYWVHPPNDTLEFKKPEFVFRRITNSLGSSDIEWPVSDSTFRILGIGDSFTEGTGVEADGTWLKRIEYLFSSELNIQVTTMNGGVGGSDPVFSYQLLQDKLLKYNPNLVILSINRSDIFELVLRGGFERFKPDGTTGNPGPSWEVYYAKSHLVRLVVHGLLRYNRDLIKNSEAEKNREDFLPTMHEVFTRLDSLSEERKFECLVVLHPLSDDFDRDSYLDYEIDSLRTILNDLDMECLDLRDRFVKEGYKTSKDVEHLFWPIDKHFNQTGYDLYADFVFEKIDPMLREHMSDSISTN